MLIVSNGARHLFGTRSFGHPAKMDVIDSTSHIPRGAHSLPRRDAIIWIEYLPLPSSSVSGHTSAVCVLGGRLSMDLLLQKPAGDAGEVQ